MDELYGEILALLPQLRAASRTEEARALLEALTGACSAREILDNLRFALGDLRDLPPDMAAAKARIEDRIEVLWAELPTG